MTKKDKVDSKKTEQIITYTLLFFISPFFSIVANLVQIVKEKYNLFLHKILIVQISVYLGLINTTKIPDSDLLNYKKYFDYAGTSGFYEYISSWDKEIVFFVYTYLSNKLWSGNFDLFITFTTFLLYVVLLLAIYKFWRNNLPPDYFYFLLPVFLVVLYQSFFGYTAHIIRQMLAGSLFMFFLIEKGNRKKTHWLLIVLAFLIHSSSAVLFLIALLPGIKEKLRIKNVLIVGGIFGFLYFYGFSLLELIAGYTSSIPYINYPLERLLNISSHLDERAFVQSGSTFIKIVIPNILLVCSLILSFSKKVPSIFRFICNTFIIYYVVLQSFSLIGLEFYRHRMSIYCFFFIPFICTGIAILFKHQLINRMIRVYAFLFICFLVFNFYYYLDTSVWDYEDSVYVLLQPIVFYFI